jgi:glycerol-3-phosphate dehydrogenase (NAD(P)+)
MEARAMQIAVLGAGSWGTALASLLARNGHQTQLWGRNSEQVRSINEKHENTRYLPGIILPATLKASTDLAATVCDADLILVVTPSHAFFETIVELAP